MSTPEIMPGLHVGLSRSSYDGIKAINQSILKLPTPAHMRHELDTPSESTDAMIFGNAVHLACFEPARFAAEVVEAPKVDRRTKEGKADWAAFLAESEGKLALDRDEYAAVGAMQRAVLAHKAAAKLLSMPADFEASMVWTDAETGVLCKGRPDFIPKTRAGLLDLKTTDNAAPWAFSASIQKYAYARQLAFYQEGLKATTGEASGWNCLIALEKSPPYVVACYEVDEASLELGRILNRRALETYAECVRTGHWPGYEGVIPISVPNWAFRSAGVDIVQEESLS